MFSINDVYEPIGPESGLDGPVRIIDVIPFDSVILISLLDSGPLLPFTMPHDQWTEHQAVGSVKPVEDPHPQSTQVPASLPKGALERYKHFLQIAEYFAKHPACLHTEKSLRTAINDLASLHNKHPKTIRRWVSEWLKSGRNPAAVVKTFVERLRSNTTTSQKKGGKRGRKGRLLALDSGVPAHEIAKTVEKAWNIYVIKQKKSWGDAYRDMLIDFYGVTPSQNSGEEFFLDPELIRRQRAPTFSQTRYQFRKLDRARESRQTELPQGHRGKAADEAPGPGFFEIDATHFQIQLVSRLSRNQLIGRPSVYLIVDIFSNAIVGYSVTLENPSWATAALALHNCFSSKQSVFDRLGLPYTSSDWPSAHLPTMLRADRAELVSNMGQEFPASGIRVEIPPPMNPEAKGTVEGKHAEIKKTQKGRFDLPGRFAKIRKRREPDGKKSAALNIVEFERILVQIILDLNREPVRPKRIPPDALAEGSRVASRIGLFEWGLTHRAGFTRSASDTFFYEHLLTKGRATLTSHGLKIKGEIFNCDKLIQNGMLSAAINKKIKITVAYNPLVASEVYFYDHAESTWNSAFNIDPEIYSLNASFPETQQFRAQQEALTHQAALNAHGERRKHGPAIKKDINDAVRERRELNELSPKANRSNIRDNRAKEKASERSIFRPDVSPPEKTAKSGKSVPVHEPSSNADSVDTLMKLWGNVSEQS